MADSAADVQDPTECTKQVMNSELCFGKCNFAEQLCPGNCDSGPASSHCTVALKSPPPHPTTPRPQVSLPTIVRSSQLDDFWKVPSIECSIKGCRKRCVGGSERFHEKGTGSSAENSEGWSDGQKAVDQEVRLWELDLYTDESELSEEEEQSDAPSSTTSLRKIYDEGKDNDATSRSPFSADHVVGPQSVVQSGVGRRVSGAVVEGHEGVDQRQSDVQISWLRDSEFIVDGHRPQLNTYLDCFWSMFHMHTETLNIWTHLIGCVLFAILTVCCLSRHDICWQEKAVMCSYLTSIVACFWNSCNFHLFICHSKEVGNLFCGLDYCGITLMIMSSTTPWIYYAFHCRPVSQVIYSIFTVAMSVTCLAIMYFLFEQFTALSSQKYRAGLFVALSLTGSLPAIHYTAVVGLLAVVTNLALMLLLCGLLAYLLGVAVYVTRFPECKWPGKFDIFLSSHQLFHIFTIIGAYINYVALRLAATNRFELGGCYQSI